MVRTSGRSEKKKKGGRSGEVRSFHWNIVVVDFSFYLCFRKLKSSVLVLRVNDDAFRVIEHPEDISTSDGGASYHTRALSK